MILHALICSVLLACNSTGTNSEIASRSSEQPAYSDYSAFLKKYVSSDGLVNYKGVVKDKTTLNKLLSSFQNNSPKSDWSEKQQLAYWINAYNLYTISLVSEHYPVKSIKDINGSSGPWDLKFIKIDGKTYSLNDIETNMIRKKFGEPRIHFAVNCASISCPKLLNEAYIADKLDEQLTRMTKAFLNDPSKNKISSDKLVISKIFDWYKSDFDKSGGVKAFIRKYSGTNVKDNASVSYMDYNWNLNEK